MTDREKLVELVLEAKINGHRLGDMFYRDFAEDIVNHLLAAGVTVSIWRDAKTDPPSVYRDECRELIPFLVCVDGTEYPFRAYYDGTTWGDGWSKIQVTKWMPLPEPKVSED